jgi:nickel/cobalt exporter
MVKLSVALFSTFTLALLHTLIPSHWLCFVVVGRAQKWRMGRTLSVTAAAGFLHALSAFLLGVVFAGMGKAFFQQRVEALERLSGFILIFLGILYLFSQFLHAGHHHDQDRQVREKTAFVALLLSLALSPCTLSIPLLVLASSSAGWGAIFLIGLVLLVTTVGVMLLLVGLTAAGVERLKFSFFDRFEKLILGLVLCILGALVFIIKD